MRSKFPSPRQQQVLDIIREVFGGRIAADRRAFLAIAKRGEAERHVLASVGRVQSAGPLTPRRRGRRFGR